MRLKGANIWAGVGAVWAALLAVTGLPNEATAQSIRIDSIAAKPGSDVALQARLGLTASLLSDTSVRHVINRTDCQDYLEADEAVLRVTWSWVDKPLTTLTARYGIKIAQAGASCDSASMSETGTNTGCTVVTSDRSFSNPATANGEFVDIPMATLLKGVDCAVASETEARVYFVLSNPSLGTNQITGQTLNFLIDTQAPAPPAVQSLAAGGENLRIEWEVVDTATTPGSRVYWSKVPFTASAPQTATSRSDVLTGTSYQISDLTNGTTYYVAVTALDANDNESAAEQVLEGTPIEVQDFWSYYKASGGAAEGGAYGCSASGGGAGDRAGGLGLLALAACLLALRRTGRRTAVGAATALIALVAGSPSQGHAESPRSASLDLRLGLYLPQIDSEFAKTNGQKPFGTVFGDSAWQKGAAIEAIVWDGFGDLGIGGSVGWWTAVGKGRKLDGTVSQDTTELQVLPLTLDVSYRFSWLAFRTGFPLVPYVKGGIAYALWWSYNGNDELSTWTGPDNRLHKAEGGVWGLHGTGGVRLLLDTMEPKAARGFDLEWGVNHSYLFCEYQVLSLNNFGNAKALDLSDRVWMFGLAFDM